METAKNFECTGLRKTSPCTSFQPVSSADSSTPASSLYFVMSRCNVRNKIIATMPDKNNMIMRELRIENQWIWLPVIFK